MWDRRYAYRVLVERLDGNRPHGRPTRRWEDNIKIIFKNWDGEHGLDCSGSG
jgi:hypothetical protein